MPEQPDQDRPESADAEPSASGNAGLEGAESAAGSADPAAAESAAGSAEPAAEPDWKRRQRLAAVFGDAMPETTSDERDPGQGSDPAGETAGDRWLRSQVPPHHG